MDCNSARGDEPFEAFPDKRPWAGRSDGMQSSSICCSWSQTWRRTNPSGLLHSQQAQHGLVLINPSHDLGQKNLILEVSFLFIDHKLSLGPMDPRQLEGGWGGAWCVCQEHKMGLVLSSPSIPSFLWGFQSPLLKGFEESLPLQRHTVRPWAQFGIFPIGQQCPNNILSTKHRDTSGGKEHKVLLSLIQTLLNCSDSFFTKPFLGKKGKFSYPEMLCRFASAFIELSKITFFFF